MNEPVGLSNNTPKNVQLNAGLFIEGMTIPDTVTDAATFKAFLTTLVQARTGILGATRGGGTFVATPEVRELEADGKRYRTKGLTRIDSWDIRLTGTLIEAYPGNFKRTLITADVNTSGKVDTLTLRTAIEDADYIDKLAWVSLLGDGTYMVIEVQNVVNLDGLTFTFQDKNEGTIPFNFAAHHADIIEQNTAPVSIKYFHPTTSNANTNLNPNPNSNSDSNSGSTANSNP